MSSRKMPRCIQLRSQLRFREGGGGGGVVTSDRRSGGRRPPDWRHLGAHRKKMNRCSLSLSLSADDRANCRSDFQLGIGTIMNECRRRRGRPGCVRRGLRVAQPGQSPASPRSNDFPVQWTLSLSLSRLLISLLGRRGGPIIFWSVLFPAMGEIVK